jgi:hypothetical protein
LRIRMRWYRASSISINGPEGDVSFVMYLAVVAADHGRRRCPPTQRQEHGNGDRDGNANRPQGERPTPSVSLLGRPRAATKEQGVAGRQTTGGTWIGRAEAVS